MKTWVKAVVSLALVFHLFAVFVFPNPESLLSRQASWILFPYGNFLGLNTTWRFFSPNPIINLLEFEAYGYNDEGDVDFEKVGRLPDSMDMVYSRESYNRLMNFAMLASSREKHFKGILKHYFCGQYPEADEIAFFHVEYVLPSIEKARIQTGDFESLVTQRKTPLPATNCKVGAE